MFPRPHSLMLNENPISLKTLLGKNTKTSTLDPPRLWAKGPANFSNSFGEAIWPARYVFLFKFRRVQVPGWLNQGLSMSTFVKTREMVVNYAREGRSQGKL